MKFLTSVLLLLVLCGVTLGGAPPSPFFWIPDGAKKITPLPAFDTVQVPVLRVDDSIMIGNYWQTVANGTDGQVLTTNGAGWARWVNAPGAGSGDDIKVDTGDASVQVVDVVDPIFQEGTGIQLNIKGSDTIEIAASGAGLTYWTESDQGDTSVFTATSPNTWLGFNDDITMKGHGIRKIYRIEGPINTDLRIATLGTGNLLLQYNIARPIEIYHGLVKKWTFSVNNLTGESGTIIDGATWNGQSIVDAYIDSLDPDKLEQDGATTGQFLKWNGTAWQPATGTGLTYFTEADDNDTSVFTATAPNTVVGLNDDLTMQGNNIIGVGSIRSNSYTAKSSPGHIWLGNSNDSVYFVGFGYTALGQNTDPYRIASWARADSAAHDTVDNWFQNKLSANNTETGIAVTYQGADSTIDFVITTVSGLAIDGNNALVAKPGTGMDTTGGTINHTAHTGDVTGGTALTIAANIIDTSDMAHAPLGKLIRDTITAEGYITDSKFSDSSIALLNATAWRLFYSNATTTAIQELALGSDGTYLKSNGASANPTWATPSGAGLTYFTEADDNDTSVFTATGPNTTVGLNDNLTMQGNNITGVNILEVEGAIYADDNDGDSPFIGLRDEDNKALLIKKFDAGYSWLYNDEGALWFLFSGDQDDYIYMDLFSANVPMISTGGACDLVINASSGEISFGDENLTTTGTLDAGATSVTGNITVSGTVDTVDLAALGSTVPKITDDTTDFKTAYGWGDHSGQNYLDNDDANVDTAAWNAASGGVWVARSDTMFLVDGDGDTLAAFWDDDAGNVWWQVATEDQTLKIKVDSLDIGGEVLTDLSSITIGIADGQLVINMGIIGASHMQYQTITPSRMDTTARNFPFDGAYHVTTAYGDSAYITIQTVAEEIEDSLNEYSLTSAIASLYPDTAETVDTIQGVLTEGGYLTGNESITLSGDATGSGATAITVTVVDDLHDHVYSNIDATTSANWATRVDNETGTGLWVFGTSPTFTTDITSPLVIGGTGTASDLSLKTTSGVGATGADMHFLVGNNGATEAMTILNNGNVGIGIANPSSITHIKGNTAGTVGSHPAGQLIIQNPTASVVSNVAITAYSSDVGGAPNQQLWYLGSTSSSNSNITFLNRRSAFLSLGTNDLTRLTISETGNVGIGQTSPDEILHLFGNNATLKLEDDSENDATINVGNSQLCIQIDPDNLITSSDICFDIDGAEVARFHASTNFGIGTLSPPERLSVVGNIATGDTATGDVDVFHYFSTDDSYITEWFKWDDGLGRFELSDDFDVTGNVTVSGTVDTVDLGALAAKVHKDTSHFIFAFSNPNAVYDTDSLLCIKPVTERAITITRIDVTCDADPATEPAMKLNHTDNFISRTTPTDIDVITTTNGVTTITSGFDDATIPATRCIYFAFTADPIAAIKSITVDITYTID